MKNLGKTHGESILQPWFRKLGKQYKLLVIFTFPHGFFQVSFFSSGLGSWFGANSSLTSSAGSHPRKRVTSTVQNAGGFSQPLVEQVKPVGLLVAVAPSKDGKEYLALSVTGATWHGFNKSFGSFFVFPAFFFEFWGWCLLVVFDAFGNQTCWKGPVWEHSNILLPWKLRCPLKKDYFNGKYIFQALIFRGHVSFLGSKSGSVAKSKVVFWCFSMTFLPISSSSLELLPAIQTRTALLQSHWESLTKSSLNMNILMYNWAMKKTWLVGLYRGLYYPDMLGLFHTPL